jgi:hypothetical protein
VEPSDIASALRGGGIPLDIIELFIITIKEKDDTNEAVQPE